MTNSTECTTPGCTTRVRPGVERCWECAPQRVRVELSHAPADSDEHFYPLYEMRWEAGQP